jgi:hypothetical protein
MKLGNVVKSNSHCDYIVQVDDALEVNHPPNPDQYGFGSFVKLETPERHWAVGLIYNSQLFNPAFLNSGPRLVSAPDSFFTPDLIQETRTLLWTVLIGTLERESIYGVQSIPSVIVPVNAEVCCMSAAEVEAFHRTSEGKAQFCYYAHVINATGAYGAQLLEQVLSEVSPMFGESDRRALEILRREILWKHTIGAML